MAEEKNRLYVLELEQKQDEITKAKNIAENATKMKSEFLANMSHEIRTPLNGVMGMANILSKTQVSSEQESYINAIVKSSENLLEILNDILDFSKIESGKIDLEEIPFDFQELCEDIADFNKPKAEEKGLDIFLKYPLTVPKHLIGDPGKIKQMFNNLISNSIKFTEVGHISINIDMEKTMPEGKVVIKCSVKDSGIGIPLDKQNLIFNKFDQADTSTTRKFGGTGLGLAIVKEISKMMGGNIGVDSTVGVGSDFWFTVGLKVDHLKENLSLNLDNIKDKKILIVDDIVTSQNILDERFRDYGASVQVKNNYRGSPELSSFNTIIMGVDDEEKLQDLYRDLVAAKIPDNALLVLIGNKESIIDANKIKDLKRLDIVFSHPIRFGLLIKAINFAQFNKLNNNKTSVITRHNIQDLQKIDSGGQESDRNKSAEVEGAEVLIVEDNKINQIVLSKMLEKYKFNISIANDGSEAVTYIKRKKYDLIFMDCQMPNLDGYEATNIIREVESSNNQARTPVVALTANAIKGDDQVCFDAGMDDYMTKPVKAEDIDKAITRWLVNSGISL